MRLAAYLLLMGITAALSAQNWPQFRGPAASGVADGKPLPDRFDVSKGENVRWSTPIPGLAVSSPVIWGDQLFVTTAISSDPSKAKFRHGLYGDVEPSDDTGKHQWKVYSLDKDTGKILWERVAHEGEPRTKRHPKSSQASCTPVTDGKVVVAHFGSEGLHAFDLKGRPLWKVDLGKLNAGWFFDPDYEWGVASSPVIWRDLVIVQADIQKDSYLAAFRLKDGKLAWKTMRDEIPSWGTPTVFDDPKRPEIITQATKFIRGYDPASGKELWRLSGNSEITTPTPLLWNRTFLVTNGYRGVQPIYAINAGAAGDITLKEGEASNEHIAWSHKRGGPYTPTPVIYGDILYILQNQGVLGAYDMKTGSRLYQQRVGNGGSYSASPVAGDGKIYLPSEDGDVYVVKAGPKYELLGHGTLGEVVMATPAISDGTLYVRSMQKVWALGAKTDAK